MMMNDAPRWRRMPLPARLLAMLLYLVTVTVLLAVIVLCVSGTHYLVIHYLAVDCGPVSAGAGHVVE